MDPAAKRGAWALALCVGGTPVAIGQPEEPESQPGQQRMEVQPVGPHEVVEVTGSRIRRAEGESASPIVTIKADANSSANRLVAFMEMIRGAGGKNISVITQQSAVAPDA